MLSWSVHSLRGGTFHPTAHTPIAGRAVGVNPAASWVTQCVPGAVFVSHPTLWFPSQFFAPLKPTRLLVEYNSHGEVTGAADVHFPSHEEAVAAMAKEGSQLSKWTGGVSAALRPGGLGRAGG